VAENNNPNTDPQQQRSAFEFWLVIAMLTALCLLVAAVLFWPIAPFSPQPSGKEASFKEVLEYRTNILSIILTAFGAWVGAGAAYFFGRENLRIASDSLLSMREVSPRERLKRTSIKQIPPTPLDWTVQETTLVSDVKDKLINEPARWFIPIVKADSSLLDVINEEAVWRFQLDTSRTPTSPPTQDTIKDLLTYIEQQPGLTRFRQIHVAIPMETTVGAANDLMDSKQVFLAIVESGGKPTHFFTTSEVRKILLQAS